MAAPSARDTRKTTPAVQNSHPTFPSEIAPIKNICCTLRSLDDPPSMFLGDDRCRCREIQAPPGVSTCRAENCHGASGDKHQCNGCLLFVISRHLMSIFLCEKAFPRAWDPLSPLHLRCIAASATHFEVCTLHADWRSVCKTVRPTIKLCARHGSQRAPTSQPGSLDWAGALKSWEGTGDSQGKIQGSGLAHGYRKALQIRSFNLRKSSQFFPHSTIITA